MRALIGFSLLALGCGRPVALDTTEPPAPIRIDDLWDNQTYDGLEVTVVDAQITSGRLALTPSFYVQEADQAAPMGLRIDLHGLVNLWPPAMGTLVELTGVVSYVDGAPRLALAANDAGVAHGIAELLTNTPTELRLHGLVAIPDLRVSSPTDPSGRADTTAGIDLESAFGVELPPWDNSGPLTGIVTSPGRISLRIPVDWQGTLDDNAPVVSTLATIRSGDIEDGTPVSIEAIQGTSFSRDSRWAVLQDDQGRGIWLDTGFWILDRPEVGDYTSWVAEVRDGGGVLRAWTTPEIIGSATPTLSDTVEHGALVVENLEQLEAPNSTGERRSGSYLVDDRFMDIESWAAPVTVEAAVFIPVDSGELTLCPYNSL